MKRSIKNVQGDIVQITTVDERWYIADEFYDEDVPFDDKYVPSASWIAGCYPKGIGFYKWLASKGWDEAEAIKQDAGKSGSKVHQAIEFLLKGGEVTLDSKFLVPDEGVDEELTPSEYQALVSFYEWHKRFEPKILAIERSFINEEYKYGGMIDLVWILEKETKVYRTTFEPGLYITDHKTSSSIWPSHRIQMSLYKRGLPYIDDVTERIEKEGFDPMEANLTLLQVGYNRNKRGWKFNKVEDQYDLALAARRIWQNEHGDKEPKQVEYPTKLEL